MSEHDHKSGNNSAVVVVVIGLLLLLLVPCGLVVLGGFAFLSVRSPGPPPMLHEVAPAPVITVEPETELPAAADPLQPEPPAVEENIAPDADAVPSPAP